MSKSIVVYTTKSCPQCAATRRILDKLGAEYSTVLADDDVETRDQIMAIIDAHDHLSRQMPLVMVTRTDAEPVMWSGFRPELIKGYCSGVAA